MQTLSQINKTRDKKEFKRKVSNIVKTKTIINEYFGNIKNDLKNIIPYILSNFKKKLISAGVKDLAQNII